MISVMSAPATSETIVENGAPRRRRSTFYVPLAADCVKTPKTNNEARRSATLTRKPSIGGGTIANATVAEARKTPVKVLPYKRPSVSPRDVLKVSTVAAAAKPPVKTVTKSGGAENTNSSHSSSSKTKSPLLRVSTKLLSSSVQALEALNTSKAPAEKGNGGSSSSPLSFIRKSSSRKLSRSSSNITRTQSTTKSSKSASVAGSESQSVITSSGSDSSSNIIQIDQPPNKELIESYVYSVSDFESLSKQPTDQDQEADDGVHSGMVII